MTFLGFEKTEIYYMILLQYFIVGFPANYPANTLKTDDDIFPKGICISL